MLTPHLMTWDNQDLNQAREYYWRLTSHVSWAIGVDSESTESTERETARQADVRVVNVRNDGPETWISHN